MDDKKPLGEPIAERMYAQGEVESSDIIQRDTPAKETIDKNLGNAASLAERLNNLERSEIRARKDILRMGNEIRSLKNDITALEKELARKVSKRDY